MRLLTILAGLVFSAQAIAANDYAVAFMYEDANQSKDIYVKEGATEAVKLPSDFKVNIYPDISSDARFIVFARGQDVHQLDIVVFDRSQETFQVVSEGPGFRLHPHFSGSANKVAYVELRAQQFDLHVHNRQTGETSVFQSSGLSSYFFPQLSSDGERVFVQRNVSETKKDIVYFDFADPSKVHQVEGLPDLCMSPNLSSDDNKVIASCFQEGQWNLFEADLISGTAKQLTYDSLKEFAPAYLPDGGILFASDRDGEFSLYHAQISTGRVQGVRSFYATAEASLYSPSVSGAIEYSMDLFADMPGEPRSSFATVRFQDKIFVFGGHQGPEHTYPEESFTNDVFSFDVKTNVWSTMSPRPVKAHGYTAETCGTQILVFGGFAFSNEHNPGWKSLDRVDIYDPITNRWKDGPKMPRRRSSNVVGKVGSKIYLIGGWDSTPKHDGDYDGRFHPEIDVFDCATMSFSTLNKPIAEPLRRAFSAVVDGDRILLVGGLGQGATHFELLDEVTAFYPTEDRFEELPKLPFPTFAPAAGILGDQMYVFGGMFKTGQYEYRYVNSVYARDLSGPWVDTGRKMQESKGFSQVVNLGDSLAVLGGHSYQNNQDRPVSTVERFSR